MTQPNNVTANPAPPTQPPAPLLPVAVKPAYVAQWHEDGHVRELRLVGEELNLLPSAFAGEPTDLEKKISERAAKLGWLLEGEQLHFVTATAAADGAEETSCTYLRFAFCPAEEPKLQKKNLRKRNPEWIESDRNRWLLFISTITLFLVVAQIFLLIRQDRQFDQALKEFQTVVQAYLWQANTPALGAAYLPDSSDIELTNYGPTPISITQATLVTDSRRSSLLAYGTVSRLREGEAQRISTLRPDVSGADIARGVVIEIVYIYLGNPYKLTWPAEVRFKGETPRIEPQGEPTVTPIKQ